MLDSRSRSRAEAASNASAASPAYAVASMLLLLWLGAAPSAAQSAVEWSPFTGEVTRAELTDLLERLESASESPGYSRLIRAEAQREAEFIRERLIAGDFQVGDRVVLRVEREAALTDTFTVAAGRQIHLPEIGSISLRGILRSELESYLGSRLREYIREPVVRAEALIRIGVLGAVNRQGFYTVPATMLLDDVLMIAGGPAGGAEVSKIRVDRGDQSIWQPRSLQQAMLEGRTLDQLNVRAGDQIIVPERRPGVFEGGVLRAILFALPGLVLVISQLM